MNNQPEPETFEHMLTVIMIQFGDARDQHRDGNIERGDKLENEAREYALSWFEEYRTKHGLKPTDNTI